MEDGFLALNVGVDMLKRYRASIAHNSSAMTLLDSQLLSTNASALLRPVAIEHNSTPQSPEQEWYENLLIERKLLVWLLRGTDKDNREEASHSTSDSNDPISTRHLATGLLRLLRSEVNQLHNQALEDALELLMECGTAEKTNVLKECVNFCSQVLAVPNKRTAFLACEATLVLGERLSMIEALRVIPFLLENSSEPPEHFLDRLTLSDADIKLHRRKVRSAAPIETYESAILRDSPVVYFTIQDAEDLASKSNNDGSETVLSMNLIGDIHFQSNAAVEGRRSGFFSPSSFIAVPFVDDLNPSEQNSFSIELWACLAISCDGGVLLSSFTNEEEAPRGYRIECRSGPGGTMRWTFRFGQFTCMASSQTTAGSTSGRYGAVAHPRPGEEDEDERRYKAKLEVSSHSWTHVVAIWDAEQGEMQLYLNGRMVESTRMTHGNRPMPNFDAPLYIGGGVVEERPHFYGNIHDFAFYPVALPGSSILRHYTMMIKGVSSSRDVSEDDGNATEEEEDDDLERESVEQECKPYAMASRVIRMVYRRRILGIVQDGDGADHEKAVESRISQESLVSFTKAIDQLSRTISNRSVSATSVFFAKRALLGALQVAETAAIQISTELQALLVDLTASADFDVSDQAARVLALCRSSSETDAVSLTALALFLQGRASQGRSPPESVLRALSEAQNRALQYDSSSSSSWIGTYLESLLMCLNTMLHEADKHVASHLLLLRQIVHSALSIALAYDWIPTYECAVRCVELLSSLKSFSNNKEEDVASPAVGSALDLEWTLVSHVALFAFGKYKSEVQTEAILTTNEWAFSNASVVEDSTISSEEADELWTVIQQTVALPVMYSMRFRNKPSEGDFLRAMKHVFFALLLHVVHNNNNSPKQRSLKQMAIRCYQTSWTVCNIMSSVHQQQEGVSYSILSERVVQASSLLHRDLSEVLSLRKRLASVEDGAKWEEDSEEELLAEDELKRRVMSFVSQLVSRRDCVELVLGIKQSLGKRRTQVNNCIEGMKLIEQIFKNSHRSEVLLLHVSSANSLLQRLGRLDIASLEAGCGHDKTTLTKLHSTVSQTLQTIIQSPLGDSDLKVDVCRRLLLFAPPDVVHVCLWDGKKESSNNLDTEDEDASNRIGSIHARYANDALDGVVAARQLSDLTSPFPHMSVSRDPVASAKDIVTQRGTHGMLSGQFYFEIAPEVQGEAVLTWVGLCSSKVNLEFACGCRVSVGNGFGIGVLVDLDAGGMFSVFALPEDDVLPNIEGFQRPVKLKALRFQCAVPPKRPLFPLLCVLTKNKRVRTSFAQNASHQVTVELDPSTVVVNSPRMSPRGSVNEMERGEIEEEEEEEAAGSTRLPPRGSANEIERREEEEEEEEEEVAGSIRSPPQPQTRPPQQVPERVLSRSAGPLAEKFDASQTELFACGQNAFGELGIAQDDKKSRKRLAEGAQTKSLYPCRIAAGNEFSGIVSSEGLVYTWGMNTKGSCGLGLANDKQAALTSVVPVPTLVRALQRKVVVRLCAQNGCENMFAITSQGEGFSWGLNKFGQCGLGSVEEIVHAPTSLRMTHSLRSVDRLVDVANGYSHTLLLLDNGSLLSCGLNSKGQLGIGGTGDIRPTPQPVVVGLENCRIRCIAVGALHSAVVDDQGRVFTFGKNDFGQLGLNDQTQPFVDVPTQVESIKSADKVACGYHFTLVTTTDGQFWGFGKNDSGQLGLGHARKTHTPERVLIPPSEGKIACVSCGTGHWIAATVEGRAFACGRNKAGAVGDGTCADRLVPSELSFPGAGSVIQVAAGFHHSLVLCGQVDETLFDKDNFPLPSPSSLFLSMCSRADNQVFTKSKSVIALHDWIEDVLSELILGNKVKHRYSEWTRSQQERFWELAVDCAMPVERFAITKCTRLVLRLIQADVVGEDNNIRTAVLCLEWLKSLVIKRKEALDLEETFGLVEMAGRRSSWSQLAIASETIHLLRELLSNGLIDEFDFVEKVLFGCDESDHSHETLMGCLSVLGGELEVVRPRGKAKLVAGEVDRGHSGLVSWFDPHSRIVAKIKMEDGETMFARKTSDLIPESKSAPYVFKHADLAERVLEKAVAIAKQFPLSGDSNHSSFSQSQQRQIGATVNCQMKSAMDESIAACKVVGAMLKSSANLVSYFVAKGHLSFVSTLLSARQSRTHLVHGLERQYTSWLVAQQQKDQEDSLLVRTPPLRSQGPRSSPAISVTSEAATNLMQLPAQTPDIVTFDIKTMIEFSQDDKFDRVWLDPVDIETRRADASLSSDLMGSGNADEDDSESNDPASIRAVAKSNVVGDEHDDDASDRVLCVRTTNGIPLDLGANPHHSDSWTLILDANFCDFPSVEEWEIVPGLLQLSSNGRLGLFPISSTTNKSDVAKIDSKVFVRLVLVESPKFRKCFLDGIKVLTQVKSDNNIPAIHSPLVIGKGLDLILASAQLRWFAMSEDEIRSLGRPTARGIPVPTLFDLANQLRDELELPFIWCLRALEKANGQVEKARTSLMRSELWLIRRGRAKARILSVLGFDIGACSRAVASTTSIMEAVGFLLDQRPTPQLTDKSAAKALSKISSATTSSFQARAQAAIQPMRFDDKFVRARGVGFGVGESASNSLALAQSSKIRVMAVKDESMGDHNSLIGGQSFIYGGGLEGNRRFHPKELFAAYARRATVIVLDADARNALLGSAKHFFVRDYLRAFPLNASSTSDVHSSGMDSPEATVAEGEEEEEEDAVRVLRRRLIHVIKKESSEALTKRREAIASIDSSRADWLENSKTLAQQQQLVPRGSVVWLPQGDRVVITGRLCADFDPTIDLVDQLQGNQIENDVTIETIGTPGPRPNRTRASADLIRTTPPPRVVPQTMVESERKRAEEEADGIAWNNSVSKSLLEILLSELALLACSTSHRMLETGLQVAPAQAFILIGRNTQKDLSIWRPVCAVSGFHSMGDVAEPGSEPPSKLVYMVSDEDGSGNRPENGKLLLTPPIGYELVYTLEDSKLKFWRPIPPPNQDFVAMGMVATDGPTPPSLNSVHCVHVSCVSPSRLGGGVWSKEDIAQVWTVENQASTFIVRTSTNNNAVMGERSGGGGDAQQQQHEQEDSGPVDAGATMDESMDDEDFANVDLDEDAPVHLENQSWTNRILKAKSMDTIVPLQLTASFFSAKTSSDTAFWILFLLVEIVARDELYPWRHRLFGPPLIHVLLNLANESALYSVRALRGLAAIVSKSMRIAPLILSIPELKAEFDALKRKSELLLAQECAESKDPDFALYSSRVCALVEFLVALNESEEEMNGGLTIRADRSNDANDLPSTVRELSSIMDVLLQRDNPSEQTLPFPDDFLMAEDTFLKLARADDTAVVESLHPYSTYDPPLEGRLLVDEASSLVVRFDRRSATSFGDGLSLEMLDEDGNVITEMLQGNFGGSVVRVPTNSIIFRFPVEQKMNWTLSSHVKGPNIKLVNGAMTAYMRKDKTWETIVATKGFARGINSWECRVDRVTTSSNIFFGVVAEGCNVESYVGCDEIGWGWIGCLACWHAGRKVKHPYGERLKTGDVVRVTLDLHRRCLSIALNGVDQGVALDRLTNPLALRGGKLYPAFAFYNKHDQITLLRGGVAF